MQEPNLNVVQPGAAVYDATGANIGTVVYVYENLEPGATGEPARSTTMLEVKTGPLGLGRHLHIPPSVVERAEAGTVFLARSLQEITERQD